MFSSIAAKFNPESGSLSYGVHKFLKVCHPLFKTLATLAMNIVSTFALLAVLNFSRVEHSNRWT